MQKRCAPPTIEMLQNGSLSGCVGTLNLTHCHVHLVVTKMKPNPYRYCNQNHDDQICTGIVKTSVQLFNLCE